MKTKYTYEELNAMATPEATAVATTDWHTREDEILPSFVALHKIVKERSPRWSIYFAGFVSDAILIAMEIASGSDDPDTKYHCQLFVKVAVILYGDVRFHAGRS